MNKNETSKKIRWNVSKNIGIVTKKLSNSNLIIKSDEKYSLAMKRLEEYFCATKSQVWILSMTLLRYFEMDDSCIFKNLSEFIECNSMDIISWKKDIDILIDRGLLEWNRYNRDFQPTTSLRQAIINNQSISLETKNEFDDITFINKFKNLYESREEREISYYTNQLVLERFERKFNRIPLVKRTMKNIPDKTSRFFLYDCCGDLISGSDSALNATISDLWSSSERINIAKKMMDETHPLFSEGYLEFTHKDNLSEATITLTSKAKQLLLDDKAFLFEEKIDEKLLIDHKNIKNKELFYDKENLHEIHNLEAILDDEKLKKIQKRLKNDNLPSGIAILLYGAPGTGKTETVYQLARKTGRSIIHVDISEMKSAWFGESEKRVKKLFTTYRRICDSQKKAGEKIPILLFNEADAVISKRKDSSQGNVAQTENAIQNIILEELENLEGIMIATTNLADNFDSAFERRFLYKMKFENPSVESKKKIWHSKLNWIPEAELKEMAEAYDFSGGQIDNIARKITMTEIISGKKPSMDEIRQFCKTEKLDNYTGKKIGFFG